MPPAGNEEAPNPSFNPPTRFLTALLLLSLLLTVNVLREDSAFDPLTKPLPERTEGEPKPSTQTPPSHPQPSLSKPFPPLPSIPPIRVPTQPPADHDRAFRFYDSAPDRPKIHLSAAPPHDVDPASFPDGAWQADDVYVNHFLDEAIGLVERTIASILKEYGDHEDLFKIAYPTQDEISNLRGPGNGDQLDGAVAYMSKDSLSYLSRMLLHHVVTRDPLRISLSGHSSAAGHGNNFNQSSAIELHNLLSPLFTNLGVPLSTRNSAMGSLGTIHSALAGHSILGLSHIQIWDSVMTEQNIQQSKVQGGHAQDFVDVFYRLQSLASDGVAPFFINGNQGCHRNNLCKTIGVLGRAGVPSAHAWYNDLELRDPEKGIWPVSKTEEDAKALPRSLRYESCLIEDTSLCDDLNHKYDGICWRDRPDVLPQKTQKKDNEQPQRAKWHPGWRNHRYRSRVYAMIVLKALHKGLNEYAKIVASSGNPLDGDYWFIGDNVKNVKSGVKSMPIGSEAGCGKVMEDVFGKGCGRICGLQLFGVTEYTPRAVYGRNLRERLVGVSPVPRKEVLYDGPEVGVVLPTDILEDGEISVSRVASGFDLPKRRARASGLRKTSTRTSSKAVAESTRNTEDASGSDVADGLVNLEDLGWIFEVQKSGDCDGTINTFCGRNLDSDCLLYGHHDGVGGLRGNTGSKELIFDIGRVEGGFVGVAVDLWESGFHSFECTVEDMANGNVVSQEVIEIETIKAGPETTRYFFKCWNDAKAATAEYLVKIQVIKSQDMSLSHIYWSIGV